MKTKHKTKHKSIEKAVPKFRERLFLMRDNPRCNHVNLYGRRRRPRLYSRCSFLAIDTRQGRDKA
mgnify:CR=1 FL=1